MRTEKLKNQISAKAEQHPFHIVDATPLPLFMAAAIVLGLLYGGPVLVSSLPWVNLHQWSCGLPLHSVIPRWVDRVISILVHHISWWVYVVLGIAVSVIVISGLLAPNQRSEQVLFLRKQKPSQTPQVKIKTRESTCDERYREYKRSQIHNELVDSVPPVSVYLLQLARHACSSLVGVVWLKLKGGWLFNIITVAAFIGAFVIGVGRSTLASFATRIKLLHFFGFVGVLMLLSSLSDMLVKSSGNDVHVDVQTQLRSVRLAKPAKVLDECKLNERLVLFIIGATFLVEMTFFPSLILVVALTWYLSQYQWFMSVFNSTVARVGSVAIVVILGMSFWFKLSALFAISVNLLAVLATVSWLPLVSTLLDGIKQWRLVDNQYEVPLVHVFLLAVSYLGLCFVTFVALHLVKDPSLAGCSCGSILVLYYSWFVLTISFFSIDLSSDGSVSFAILAGFGGLYTLESSSAVLSQFVGSLARIATLDGGLDIFWSRFFAHSIRVPPFGSVVDGLILPTSHVRSMAAGTVNANNGQPLTNLHNVLVEQARRSVCPLGLNPPTVPVVGMGGQPAYAITRYTPPNRMLDLESIRRAVSDGFDSIGRMTHALESRNFIEATRLLLVDAESNRFAANGLRRYDSRINVNLNGIAERLAEIYREKTTPEYFLPLITGENPQFHEYFSMGPNMVSRVVLLHVGLWPSQNTQSLPIGRLAHLGSRFEKTHGIFDMAWTMPAHNLKEFVLLLNSRKICGTSFKCTRMIGELETHRFIKVTHDGVIKIQQTRNLAEIQVFSTVGSNHIRWSIESSNGGRIDTAHSLTPLIVVDGPSFKNIRSDLLQNALGPVERAFKNCGGYFQVRDTMVRNLHDHGLGIVAHGRNTQPRVSFVQL